MNIDTINQILIIASYALIFSSGYLFGIGKGEYNVLKKDNRKAEELNDKIKAYINNTEYKKADIEYKSSLEEFNKNCNAYLDKQI